MGDLTMIQKSSCSYSIWLERMIEATVMQHGHGSTGMKRITLTKSALEYWARNVHTSCVLEPVSLSLKWVRNPDFHKQKSWARTGKH